MIFFDIGSLSVLLSTALESSNESEYVSLDTLFKAASDPLRVQILQILKGDSFGVLELCHLFDVKQSAMSHHLKVMAGAGLLTRRRQGNSIFYRRVILSGSDNEALKASMFAAIDALSLPLSLQEGLERIRLLRSESSRQFFSEFSERFKSKQDLISPIDEYKATVSELLDAGLMMLSDSQRKQAIEIGPGEGEFLEELASRFEHVIALDNSESMLDRCQKVARKKRIDNVGYINGDTKSMLDLMSQLERGTSVSARRANCVVANMVLHHNASPRVMFKNISKMLSASGICVVSELCSHEQGWVRDAAGDVWLGFDEEQLHHWAAESGLQNILSSYTALKNGFRIQIHAYQLKP